jgi:hypothetical protein
VHKGRLIWVEVVEELKWFVEIPGKNNIIYPCKLKVLV